MTRSLRGGGVGPVRPLVPGALVILGGDAGGGQQRDGSGRARARVAVADDLTIAVEPVGEQQLAHVGSGGGELPDVDVHGSGDVSLPRIPAVAGDAAVLLGA